MKKEIIALVGMGLASLAAPMSATAAAIASNTSTSQSQDINTTACALLTETVTINLSKNVSAGYSCNTGTNAIGFGACHTGGKKYGSNNNNIYVGVSTGGSVDAVQTSPCNADGSNANTAATTAATNAS